FGEPPEPALNLMTWLQIKSQALAAGVNSIVTTPEEFIVRFPEGSPMDREKLRRRFGRDPSVRVGPQFVRLDRRSLGDAPWLEALTNVLETLAKGRGGGGCVLLTRPSVESWRYHTSVHR